MSTIGFRWAAWGAALALTLALAFPALGQDEPVEDLDVFLEPAEEAPAEGGGGDAFDDLSSEPGGGGLEGLSTDLGGGGDDFGAGPAAEPTSLLDLTFNGYVKPLLVWEQRTFPDEFPVADKDRFTTVGARTQLRVMGALQDKAQFFTAVNLDFNEVDQDTDTASTSSETGNVRMVESYIDLFGESTRWRVGSQLVTWSFMDGFEVPTDRLNARDLSYKSSELEDLKLASTGAQFRWSFAGQRWELYYIPVGKVNRLSPDFEAVFDQEQTQGREVESGDSKYATHFAGNVGFMDYQLNYVVGPDPRPDLGEVDSPAEGEPELFKRYHNVSSPGLDLQFEVGDTLLRLSGVYWNTEDTENDDPLIQNDWWQAMAGVEFWMGSALVNFNFGRREVIDHDDDPSVEFENILLGQTSGKTNIVAGSFVDSYLTGAALEVNFLFAYLWEDESGEVVAVRARPSFIYNFGDGVALTIIPYHSNEIGIETQELYTELKFSF